jgi:hypothetical protein
MTDVSTTAAIIGPRPPTRCKYRDGTGAIHPRLANTAGTQNAHEVAYARRKNQRIGLCRMTVLIVVANLFVDGPSMDVANYPLIVDRLRREPRSS